MKYYSQWISFQIQFKLRQVSVKSLLYCKLTGRPTQKNTRFSGNIDQN